MSGNFREWMYNRINATGNISAEFRTGVDQFMSFENSQPLTQSNGGKFYYPCSRCENKNFYPGTRIWKHLYTNGFMPDYYIWYYHGEELDMDLGKSCGDTTWVGGSNEEVGNVVEDRYIDMVNDAFPHHNVSNDNYYHDEACSSQNVEDPIRNHSKKFYDLLEGANNPLYDGCRDGHSQLSFAAELMQHKADHNMSERLVDSMCGIFTKILPEGNQATRSNYETEKLMSNLGLPCHAIDVFVHNCMIYWKEDEGLEKCWFCNSDRWMPNEQQRKTNVSYSRMWYMSIADRLKRMYQSEKTAAAMRWHAEHQLNEGEMSHPSDATEWKYFQDQHPQFAEEPRNVYLGLCTDGFNPFGMSNNHSLWPVILTPYNLPPCMCMNTEYLFLTIMNYGPNHPGASLDIFLRPLIDELKELWSTGVDAYDVSLNQNFKLRAVLLWTISDFPAYGMLSGWSTHGKLACPICMEDTKSFYLKHGRKTCWFDCHRRFLPLNHPLQKNKKDFLKKRDAKKDYPPESLTSAQIYYQLKRVNPPKTKVVGGNGHEKRKKGFGKEHNWFKESIFWELPYWKDLALRHNLDVMHVEKNFFDNIMYTLMCVQGKSKDNVPSRLDIKNLCDRPHLYIDDAGLAPFPPYSLVDKAKISLLECVKHSVKFPDGYASNLSSYADLDKAKFSGMKSHDCHVFMERLLPFILAELLVPNVHHAIADSSSSSWRYDVFPSFRGEDIRNNFLSHLLKEFESKGILTFRDDHIERSHMIGPELIEAIRESKISVVLFSENYASSSWCLDELVEILKCKKEQGSKVMPIFYKVDPSDVRKQTGKFGMGFSKTCYGKTEEQQHNWKQALIDAASIVGDHPQDWVNEADMITTISNDVLNKLNATPSRDFDDLVGIDAHIAKMNSLLCFESEEARIVGICGSAGIGKTTIARVLFNQYYENFKLSLFMENVGESYGKTNLDDNGLKLHLQKKFLSKLLDQKDLRMRHLGTIEERLKSQKVLIVLDNVDNIVQLKALSKEPQWFGNKSRVIVITQNKQLLVSHNINHMYEVSFPSKQEALTIFCQHAFNQSSPPDDFKELAIEIATLAGHLPLGLRVLGSFMSGKSKEEWEFSLPTLKTRIDGEIEKVLKVGYDGLHKDDKALFLHIACLFNGHHENNVKEMVATNNELDVSFGLKVLSNKSLIRKYEDGRFEMHSLLQQLGREVVRDQSIYEPGKRQFLTNARDICGVLSNNTGTGTVLGISLDMCEMKEELYISEEAFEEMRNLFYLRMYRSSSHVDDKMMVKLQLPKEGLSYLPRLRFLQWHAFPHKFLPSRFRTECLVELSMTHSKLEKLWEGVQPLRSLTFMNLSRSQNLKIIPNLLEATNLVTLDLSWCENLVELPSSIQNLHKLNLLEMSCCTRLETIPTNINLASLSHLHFRYCSRLKTFPEISTNLTYLKIRGTAITEVPPSVRHWPKIVEICMERTMVKRLDHVPYILDTLCLRGNTDLVSIPNNLKYLRWLRMIDVSFCISIISLPTLPDTVFAITALNCKSLQRLHGHFRNGSISLNFSNCLKLDQEAKEKIHRSVYRFTLFPGEQVPEYFPHRAKGKTIMVRSDLVDLTKYSRFKVCLVLGEEKRFEGGETCFYKNMRFDY